MEGLSSGTTFRQTRVVDFLARLRDASRRVQGQQRCCSPSSSGRWCRAGELTRWTVALIGGGDGEPPSSWRTASAVNMLQACKNGDHEDRYSIGRLLSPRDEAIDLDEAAWKAALAADARGVARRSRRDRRRGQEPDAPNGPAIRKVRGFGAEGVAAHPERGLLLLYALDPAKARPVLPPDTPPVIAFGISFPGSNSGLKVEYKVNNVLWEQEYGPAD